MQAQIDLNPPARLDAIEAETATSGFSMAIDGNMLMKHVKGT